MAVRVLASSPMRSGEVETLITSGEGVISGASAGEESQSAIRVSFENDEDVKAAISAVAKAFDVHTSKQTTRFIRVFSPEDRMPEAIGHMQRRLGVVSVRVERAKSDAYLGLGPHKDGKL